MKNVYTGFGTFGSVFFLFFFLVLLLDTKVELA